MSKATESIRNLREFVNEYVDLKYRLMKDLESWFRLCSAMDVLEDTDMAIQGYLDADASKVGLGETYLHYYGLFQAMSVQQDAVASTCKSLLKSKFDMGPSGPLEPIWDIRQTRISAFGHPTNRELKDKPKGQHRRYCQVVQVTMNKSRFQLGTSNPLAAEGDKNDMEDIDTLDMVRRQQEWTSYTVDKLVEELKEEHKEYRQKHLERPLSDVFPKNVSYYLGKVCEGVEHGPDDPTYFVTGLAGLDVICGSLKQLEERLIERELGLDTYSSIELICDELQHPIDQLRLLFSQQVTGEELERLSKDCNAFAWFVSNKITGWIGDSLKEVIDEIDESWGSGD